MSAPWPPIVELLPHAGPARLLDSVTSWDAQGVACAATVPSAGPHVIEGRVSALLTLELIAQGAAAFVALAARQAPSAAASPPRPGYLVAARDLATRVVHLTPGAALRVEVTADYLDGGSGSFSGRVLEGGTQVAAGTITVVQPGAAP